MVYLTSSVANRGSYINAIAIPVSYKFADGMSRLCVRFIRYLSNVLCEK